MPEPINETNATDLLWLAYLCSLRRDKGRAIEYAEEAVSILLRNGRPETEIELKLGEMAHA